MKILGVLATLFVASAFGSDVTRGNQIDAVLRDGAPQYEDSEVCSRVAEVGRKVVAASGNKRGFDYTFYVLNSSDVTAFSAPGGRVYVTTGLLGHLESEDELAAVLGHEIAHVDERHLMQTEMSARERVVWQTGLQVGSIAAASIASTLVQQQIGNSMTTYTIIPSTTPARTVAVRGPGGLISAQTTPAASSFLLVPQFSGGAQIAGLAANAASMITARGGSMLLGAYYHGFKDQYEYDADRLAIQYTKTAGYDPSALVSVLARIGGTSEEIDSTGISRMHSSSKVLQQRTEKSKENVPSGTK